MRHWHDGESFCKGIDWKWRGIYHIYIYIDIISYLYIYISYILSISISISICHGNLEIKKDLEIFDAVCSLPWYAKYARYDNMMIWWESTSGNLWSYIEIWIMVGSQWNLPVICASHAKWWAMPFSKLSYGKWSVRAWFTMTYHDLPSRKWWFAMVALKYLRVHSSLYHTSLFL